MADEQALKAVEEARARLEAARSLAPDGLGVDLSAYLALLVGALVSAGEDAEAARVKAEQVEFERLETETSGHGFLAVELERLGGLRWAADCHDEAFEAWNEALDLYRELASEAPGEWLADLAMCLLGLGGHLREMGRTGDADACKHEADACDERLFAMGPEDVDVEGYEFIGGLASRASGFNLAGQAESARVWHRKGLDLVWQRFLAEPEYWKHVVDCMLSEMWKLTPTDARPDWLTAYRETYERMAPDLWPEENESLSTRED